MDDKPVGFYIKSINNILDKKFNMLLSKYDITKTQADIVMYIYGKQKEDIVSQRDIEKNFLLSNPTVTGILNRLEDKGFIKKEISKKDNRQNSITVTDKFIKIKRHLLDNIRKKKNSLFNNMSEEELFSLRILLKKVYENLIEEE